MTRTCKNSIDGVALLKSIDDKNDLKKAKDSLTLFAAYFEDKIRTFAEVQASHLGLTEAAAFPALQCAFVKVWKYPYSFDMNKSNCSKEEAAIIVWLKSIIASQLFEYAEKGTCVSQTEEEDLSVMENTRSFVEYHMPDIQPGEKTELVLAFDKKLSVLDEKHRIIYLTYKAYELRGKKLPRRLLGKLRERLGISQTTVRVYKREAYMALNDKPKF